MTRIAILGGGISGLAAAYELELARKKNPDLDWHLYEATNRLGGIVETTQQQGYTLEGGPDGWVSEKPWARDLSIELGLEADLIASNDATRKTYIGFPHSTGDKLLAMPDHMRMMVPEDLATLDSSPLFSAEAKAAYAAELTRAEELKASAPNTDESVASFVLRHFGPEVLEKIGAPLLSGVFGGDVETLSVKAVMAPFVKMEREHGSLILALQIRSKERGDKPRQAIFTSLRNGLGSLTAAIIARLPPERLHLNQPAISLKREGKLWCLRTSKSMDTGFTGKAKKHFRHVIVATSLDAARTLLTPIDDAAANLLPTDASSAVLAAFAWPAGSPQPANIPPGFGFLVPSKSAPSESAPSKSAPSKSAAAADASTPHPHEPALLTATFVDQKFPHRSPESARVIRVFFGAGSAEYFANTPDSEVAAAALRKLETILGTLPAPDPTLTTVRRWPRSLPQYAVGHLDRMAELDTRVAALGNLTLLGNSYRGVGLPDLIHNARESVRKIAVSS